VYILARDLLHGDLWQLTLLLKVDHLLNALVEVVIATSDLWGTQKALDVALDH
jgi:hypothetical protein